MKRLLKKLIDMFPNQSKRKKKFYKEIGQTLFEEKESEQLFPLKRVVICSVCLACPIILIISLLLK